MSAGDILLAFRVSQPFTKFASPLLRCISRLSPKLDSRLFIGFHVSSLKLNDRLRDGFQGCCQSWLVVSVAFRSLSSKIASHVGNGFQGSSVKPDGCLFFAFPGFSLFSS